jgi:hypothetical protein
MELDKQLAEEVEAEEKEAAPAKAQASSGPRVNPQTGEINGPRGPEPTR